MKHILTLGAIIFVILGVTNIIQNETVSFVLAATGGTYLVVQMLRGNLKGGSA